MENLPAYQPADAQIETGRRADGQTGHSTNRPTKGHEISRHDDKETDEDDCWITGLQQGQATADINPPFVNHKIIVNKRVVMAMQ